MGLTKGDAWKLIVPFFFSLVSPIVVQRVPQYPWLAKLIMGLALASLLTLVFSQVSKITRILLIALGLAVPFSALYIWAWAVRFLSMQTPMWVTALVLLGWSALIAGGIWLLSRPGSSVQSYDHDRFWGVDWHWNWPSSGGAPYNIVPVCPKCGMVLVYRRQSRYPLANALQPSKQPAQFEGRLVAKYVLATGPDPIFVDCDDCEEHYCIQAGASRVEELEDLILRKIDKHLRTVQSSDS